MIERVHPVYLQQSFPPEMYFTAADHKMPTSSTASQGLHILYIDYNFWRSTKSQSFCCMLCKIQQERHADSKTSAEGRQTLVRSHRNSISGHDDPFFWSARRPNDPRSLSFDPVDAFRPGYSARRRPHANKSLEQIGPAPGRTAITDPELCVGIITVQRDGHYLRSSVVSFLDGLSPEERDGVRLETLIAATGPGTHSAHTTTRLGFTAERTAFSRTKQRRERSARCPES